MKTISMSLRLFLYCATLFVAGHTRAQLEGTLFTEPDERAYLDYLRDEFRRNNAGQGFNIEEAAIPDIPAVPTPANSGPAEYSFGGILSLRSGRRSIWLNGALIVETELPEGFSLTESDRIVSLRIVQDGKSYLLRPGQRLHVATGTIAENSSLAALPAPADEVSTAIVDDAAVLRAAEDEANETSSAIESGTNPGSANTNTADAISSLADTLAELTPAQQEALASLLEARQEASANEAVDAPE